MFGPQLHPDLAAWLDSDACHGKKLISIKLCVPFSALSCDQTSQFTRYQSGLSRDDRAQLSRAAEEISRQLGVEIKAGLGTTNLVIEATADQVEELLEMANIAAVAFLPAPIIHEPATKQPGWSQFKLCL